MTQLNFGQLPIQTLVHDHFMMQLRVFSKRLTNKYSFVPFSKFVFDLLHANPRISEHIFEKGFRELVILDWRDK